MKKLLTLIVVAILGLLLNIPLSLANIYPDMIHYWNFNDGSANDLIGTNHGDIHGNVISKPGVDGKGLYFDGAWNSYISFSPTLNVTNEMSAEFWINPGFDTNDPDAYPSWPGVRNTFRKNDTIRFHITGKYYSEPGLNVVFQYEGGGWADVSWVPLAGLIQQDKWSQIVGTFKRNDFARLYVNGELKLSIPTIDEPLKASTNKLVVGQLCDLEGGEWGRNDETWIGLMDEIAIYDRALSSDEVRQHYKNVVVPIPATVWLLGSVLLGLPGLRRKSRN